MLALVDDVLNRITMYRLVLYELVFLVGAAAVLSAFGVLHWHPFMILFSVFFITILCWATNTVFARVFGAPVNVESAYITALILVLLITPPSSAGDGQYLEIAAWASIWAMASKYIVAIRHKHVFNPAAFGVAVTSLALNQSAAWWVGTLPMLPFVAVGGFLIVRKIRRADLVWSFLVVALLAILAQSYADPASWGKVAWNVLAYTPAVFFVTVMLTEPLTTPPTRAGRTAYGALTGLLNAPWAHIGSFYGTPELALLASNVFSYLVSPKEKLLLTLKEKQTVASDVVHFRFTLRRSADAQRPHSEKGALSDPELAALRQAQGAPSLPRGEGESKGASPLRFRPGQYLEWTLEHPRPDNRGNRRYFTLASAPTEPDIAIGVKFYQPMSSFKQQLLSLEPGDRIVASQRAGEFVLPEDRIQKLVFLAGGIGITPFRSMVKDMLDRNERRPIVLFYSNRTPADVAYRDLFDEAARRLGIKTVYTVTDATNLTGWTGLTDRIDATMLEREVPDLRERHFFISGPRAMVVAFRRTLRGMGIPRARIKTDYFPGFA